ncbi:MAG: hypothetical protein WCL46_09420 [Chlorobium sp.]
MCSSSTEAFNANTNGIPYSAHVSVPLPAVVHDVEVNLPSPDISQKRLHLPPSR